VKQFGGDHVLQDLEIEILQSTIEVFKYMDQLKKFVEVDHHLLSEGDHPLHLQDIGIGVHLPVIIIDHLLIKLVNYVMIL